MIINLFAHLLGLGICVLSLFGFACPVIPIITIIKNLSSVHLLDRLLPVGRSHPPSREESSCLVSYPLAAPVPLSFHPSLHSCCPGGGREETPPPQKKTKNHNSLNSPNKSNSLFSPPPPRHDGTNRIRALFFPARCPSCLVSCPFPSKKRNLTTPNQFPLRLLHPHIPVNFADGPVRSSRHVCTHCSISFWFVCGSLCCIILLPYQHSPEPYGFSRPRLAANSSSLGAYGNPAEDNEPARCGPAIPFPLLPPRPWAAPPRLSMPGIPKPPTYSPVLTCSDPGNRRRRICATSSARSLRTLRQSDAYPVAGTPPAVAAALLLGDENSVCASCSKISFAARMPIVSVLTTFE